VNIRGYLETPLTSPLIAGDCYHFEMYASLSDISMYTTDAIGACFSNTLVTGIPYTTNIPFAAQVNNAAGNVLDATNWTLISGDFIANGGESYIVCESRYQ
jgi:hypothetical protein